MFFKIKKKNLKKPQPILMYIDLSSWTVIILIYCLSSSILPHIFTINACRRWATYYPSSVPGPLSQVWVNKYWAKITKPDACKELRWGWRLEHWMKRVNLLYFIFVYYTQTCDSVDKALCQLYFFSSETHTCMVACQFSTLVGSVDSEQS